MRIALVTHYYSSHLGGIEIVAGELAARSAARGHTTRWVASDLGQPPEARDGVEVLPASAWNTVEDWLHVPVPIWPPGATRTLSRAFRDIDLVHVHDYLYHGSLLALRLARRRRIPVVVTQHIARVPYRSAMARAAFALAERTLGAWALSRADRVVFVSDRVQRHFAGMVRPEHCRVIRNGVDFERFRALPAAARVDARAELGLTPGRPLLLFVGRFVEKKGLHILAPVVRSLTECQWAFAGWGSLDPSSWGSDNVRVLGRLEHDRLVRWYQAADHLVLPSVGEGFPLVVQEAMACGTPALVTAETAEGCAEALPYLDAIDSLAPAAWTSAIRAAIARPDPEARRREVALAAARLWSWERASEEYDRLFRELRPDSAVS